MAQTTPTTGIDISELNPFVSPDKVDENDQLSVYDSSTGETKRVLLKEIAEIETSGSGTTTPTGVLNQRLSASLPLSITGPVAGPGGDEETYTLTSNSIYAWRDGSTNSAFSGPSVLRGGRNITLGYNPTNKRLSINCDLDPGIQGLTIRDDSNAIVGTDITTIQFTGDSVSLTNPNGGNKVVAEVNSAGGGGGIGGISIKDEGSALSTLATTLNFVGDGVTATGTGSTKTINIPGSTGTGTGEVNTGTNLGSGARVYQGKSGSILKFRSLTGSSTIEVVQSEQEINFNYVGPTGGGGEINTGSNLGAGEGNVFKGKDVGSVVLDFRSLKAGNNITISEDDEEITIESSGAEAEPYREILAPDYTWTESNYVNKVFYQSLGSTNATGLISPPEPVRLDPNNSYQIPGSNSASVNTWADFDENAVTFRNCDIIFENYSVRDKSLLFIGSKISCTRGSFLALDCYLYIEDGTTFYVKGDLFCGNLYVGEGATLTVGGSLVVGARKANTEVDNNPNNTQEDFISNTMKVTKGAVIHVNNHLFVYNAADILIFPALKIDGGSTVTALKTTLVAGSTNLLEVIDNSSLHLGGELVLANMGRALPTNEVLHLGNCSTISWSTLREDIQDPTPDIVIQSDNSDQNYQTDGSNRSLITIDLNSVLTCDSIYFGDDDRGSNFNMSHSNNPNHLIAVDTGGILTSRIKMLPISILGGNVSHLHCIFAAYGSKVSLTRDDKPSSLGHLTTLHTGTSTIIYLTRQSQFVVNNDAYLQIPDTNISRLTGSGDMIHVTRESLMIVVGGFVVEYGGLNKVIQVNNTSTLMFIPSSHFTVLNKQLIGISSGSTPFVVKGSTLIFYCEDNPSQLKGFRVDTNDSLKLHSMIYTRGSCHLEFYRNGGGVFTGDEGIYFIESPSTPAISGTRNTLLDAGSGTVHIETSKNWNDGSVTYQYTNFSGNADVSGNSAANPPAFSTSNLGIQQVGPVTWAIT